ncbi:MAG: restriction endonuclease subunit S [Lachnospiraceae bacterium]|nr:restriction endonuclease subunit S [Lachnospiraceae bacterium]MBR4082695.1 restriction endonuclease subunit S [Lachnospiraceae bacterium]
MKEYKFSEICRVINGRAYKQEELLQNGTYKVLRVGNFFSSDRWYYSDLELDEDKYCNSGDLLFAWSASFGPKIWRGDKTIYHYHIWKLVENSSYADRNYIYYWLLNSVNKLTAGVHGSVMAHMTKKEMEDQKINLPDLNIQKKVGAILALIDEKIRKNEAINRNLQAA